MPPHPSPDLSVEERERERPIKSDLRLDVRIIFHADTELALPAGTKRRDRYRAIDHQRSHQETSSRYTRDVCPRYRSRSNARIYARTHTHTDIYMHWRRREKKKKRRRKGGGLFHSHEGYSLARETGGFLLGYFPVASCTECCSLTVLSTRT